MRLTLQKIALIWIVKTSYFKNESKCNRKFLGKLDFEIVVEPLDPSIGPTFCVVSLPSLLTLFVLTQTFTQLSMSIVFEKNGKFILLDHGTLITTPRSVEDPNNQSPESSKEDPNNQSLESSKEESYNPIPGLFHQPKQYFNSKFGRNSPNLRDLFRSIGYGSCEEQGTGVLTSQEKESTVMKRQEKEMGSPKSKEKEPAEGIQKIGSCAVTQEKEPGVRAEEKVSVTDDDDVSRKRRKVSKRPQWLTPGTVPVFKGSRLAEDCYLRKNEALSPYVSRINCVVNHVTKEISIKYESLFNRRTSNDSDSTIIIKVKETSVRETSYIMPPRSSFLMSDKALIYDFMAEFDFVVVDPPWANKSVNRSSYYQMLSTTKGTPDLNNFARKRKYEQSGYMFDEINIPRLLVSGGVLAVWITNKQAHIDHVLNELFPKWGIELQKVCFWLKVTSSGDPICPFGSPHKKPYEILLFGKKLSQPVEHKDLSSSELKSLLDFPESLLEFQPTTHETEPSTSDSRKVVIASIPCVQHSRKPPLEHVYRALFPSLLPVQLNVEPRYLELFARSLNPGWLSLGNEVLLFQDSKFFS